MKIIRQIEFTGKNLNDIFNLPCVKSIHKSTYNLMPIVTLWESYMRGYGYNEVYIGDILAEFEDKKWDILPPHLFSH